VCVFWGRGGGVNHPLGTPLAWPGVFRATEKDNNAAWACV